LKCNLVIWRALKVFAGLSLFVINNGNEAFPQENPVKSAPGEQNPWALPKTPVDRSILSVEKKVYALSDIRCLLALWKTALPEDKVPLATDWSEGSGFQFDRTRSFLKQFEKWPSDAQRILFIVLSWPETSRRSALASSEEDRTALIQKLRSPQNLRTLEPELARAVQSLTEGALMERADQVLRALKLHKTQGGLSDASAAVQWFWHQKYNNPEAPAR
jgi:hypothetical protein